MKLKELLEIIPEEADITFEIVEETYPVGILAKNILANYPRAAEYKVTELQSGVSSYEGKDVPTLCVEVSNGNLVK